MIQETKELKLMEGSLKLLSRLILSETLSMRNDLSQSQMLLPCCQFN